MNLRAAASAWASCCRTAAVDAGLRRHTASAPTASNTASKMTVLRVMGLKNKRGARVLRTPAIREVSADLQRLLMMRDKLAQASRAAGSEFEAAINSSCN